MGERLRMTGEVLRVIKEHEHQCYIDRFRAARDGDPRDPGETERRYVQARAWLHEAIGLYFSSDERQ